MGFFSFISSSFTAITALSSLFTHSPPPSGPTGSQWNVTANGTAIRIKRGTCKLTSSHDLTRDRRLFRHNSAIYSEDEALDNWTCAICSSGFQLHSVVYSLKYNTKAMVGFDSVLNATVLVFRGTSENEVHVNASNKNWFKVNLNGLNFDNMTCKPSALGKKLPGYVYCGFYKAYARLHKRVLKAVNQSLALNPGSDLIVTGHSMGGTLAALASLAVRIKKIHKRPMMVTYGTPAMADRSFTSFFNCQVKRALRIYNRWDPVPYSMELLSWTTHLGKGFLANPAVPWDLNVLDLHSEYLGVSTWP